ncbi:MAG: hypothetical protein LBU47_02685, partial [Christensenellaceae bacterium]|nr:hypothetical protein [Christensenellaceae bacterium]
MYANHTPPETMAAKHNGRATIFAVTVGFVVAIAAAAIGAILGWDARGYEPPEIPIDAGGVSQILTPYDVQVLADELLQTREAAAKANAELDSLKSKYTALESDNLRLTTALQNDNLRLTAENEKLQEKVRQIASWANIELVDGEPILHAEKSLFELTPTSHYRWNLNDGSLINSLGTRYANNTQFLITSQTVFASTWAEFDIDGEWTKLKGTLAAHEDMKRGAAANIRILVDTGHTGEWEEVYPKGASAVTRKTEPFPLDV